MKFKAVIEIMPRPEILDPQGKATLLGLHNLGFDQLDNVRIGRRIELQVEAADADKARETVETACKKLLTNPIIERYDLTIEEG